jgi:hypothetical protein
MVLPCFKTLSHRKQTDATSPRNGTFGAALASQFPTGRMVGHSLPPQWWRQIQSPVVTPYVLVI